MSTMTGGDAVYHALKAANVSCVFGIPSQHNLGLYDALCRHGDIRVIGTRHEQGAVHAADGYARATGKLGVAIVSTGPGTVNAVNGLYEAGFASSPVLLLTTQVDTRYLGRGKGFIHDADQQLAMLRTVTRRSERVLHARDIAATIHRVMADIATGRPQPGAVEIPTDLLLATLPDETSEYASPAPLPADDAMLDAVAQRLGQSRKPLLWVGGGCVSANAASAVRELAERLGAPVVSSVNGRGVLPAGHPLYVGCQTHLPAFNELLAQADLVLAIGTRFQALASQYWQQPMPKNLAHIDADSSVIGRNYPAALSVVADARLAVEGLLSRVAPIDIDSGFAALAREVRHTLKQTVNRMIGPDHQRIVEAIEALLPADSPVVGDATITANTWGNYLLSIRAPRIGHYSTGLAIGPALPIGIGAALGTGKKTLVIHGDGGVMLNLAEIATAVQTRALLVLCVFNDSGYGVLKGLQRVTTGRPYAVDLHTPDFVALAAAMGMPGTLVRSADAFAHALESALAVDGPYLIEVDLASLEPIRLFG
ncbi:putative 2-ketoarginine decarboxylase AruI [Paraburkholderia caffeinitolerans]|uniref:Putative 2-ketoarginine decarboxylase AruI n=1 Tax=Paraburkholderia caffeinitolerans TaxID=1723730 RepID=A0A6J5FWU7_9BURK|nr:thiamine pyrophosphate-binding protein [Paraburkholderia caffeinitolerans]CAB3785599.1 putative 2-ketoarginine decarboxylase AruI [Paraburkholderia caffeinitolerans]